MLMERWHFSYSHVYIPQKLPSPNPSLPHPPIPSQFKTSLSYWLQQYIREENSCSMTKPQLEKEAENQISTKQLIIYQPAKITEKEYHVII